MAEADNVSDSAPSSALDALNRAETAVSSAAPTPDGTGSGDTSVQVGAPDPKATPDATGQPVAVDTPVAAAGTGGEAPQSRIEAAVRNARAEVERQLGWAKGFNPQEVQEAVQWLRELRRDGKAFHAKLGQELGANQPQPEETYPETDYTDNEGKAKFYTADHVKKALEIQERRIMARVNKTVKPFVDEQQSREVTHRAEGVAIEAITEARKMEYFRENEQAISQALAAMDPQVKEKLGPPAALYAAYGQVLATVVTPRLREKIEAETRQNYEKKAATSIGSVHPSAQGGPGVKAPTMSTPQELAKHMEGIAARMSA